MTFDINAIAAAAAQTTDMTQVQTGGGGYTPPAEGPCRLRFVGYVETGSHLSKGFQGAPDKVKPEAKLFFEINGPKHKPVTTQEGKTVPCAVVEITLAVSLNEKAGFKKLFDRLNYKGTARHMAQLLGEPFLGTLVHRPYIGKDGKPRVALNLKDDSGFTIRPPRRQDENDEWVPVPVDPAISPLRCFIWSSEEGLKQQWDSLFIDGEYPAKTNEAGEEIAPAKSKNYLQARCLAALNFKGSKLDQLLGSGGKGLDLPEVQAAEPAADDTDPYAGI
jgi:hypothetical protein